MWRIVRRHCYPVDRIATIAVSTTPLRESGWVVLLAPRVMGREEFGGRRSGRKDLYAS